MKEFFNFIIKLVKWAAILVFGYYLVQFLVVGGLMLLVYYM